MAYHVGYLEFLVGGECLALFNVTLSFSWSLPRFFNGKLNYCISLGTPLLNA